MLRWALVFLVIAFIFAILGFGGLAHFAVDIAQILFAVFIVLFLISVVVYLIRGRGPPPSP